jgi:hypothetical protein
LQGAANVTAAEKRIKAAVKILVVVIEILLVGSLRLPTDKHCEKAASSADSL